MAKAYCNPHRSNHEKTQNLFSRHCPLFRLSSNGNSTACRERNHGLCESPTYWRNGKNFREIKHGDHKKGMVQLQKLAEQGDAVAQINYGSECLDAQNYEKAYEWFKKAANQEMGMAYGQLAYPCREGLGVAQDYNKVFAWYEKGAIAGDVSARFDLGLMYYHE
jgi:hypothetical protein